MLYSEEKLLNFKKIIFKEVEDNIKNLKEESLKTKKETLEKTKKQTTKDILPHIEKEIKNIKTNYKYNITKSLFEKKRELLIFRNSLIDNIIELSKKKILEFSKTEEYYKCLNRNIEDLIKKYSCKNPKVLLRKYDFEKNINITEKNYNIVVDYKNDLGGFKIVDDNNKIEIDETFETRLNFATENFYKKCEFDLKFF